MLKDEVGGAAVRPLRIAGGEPERSATQVLVIDDEPNVSSFIARALRAKGYDVDTAEDGRRGLDRALSHVYELVLLDLRMPNVNGLQVLRELMRVRPQQQVMVVSAAAGVEVKVRCLEHGAIDFLAKPFELAELIARVETRVARKVPAEPELDRFLQVGSIRLDLHRQVVEAGAGPVRLSTREFHLLRFLMRRPGTPCSREQLLREVWDTPFDPGTNVVDVYVHRLRHKLGEGRIETLRNVGYLLEAV